jgi:hypothetical protein
MFFFPLQKVCALGHIVETGRAQLIPDGGLER